MFKELFENLPVIVGMPNVEADEINRIVLLSDRCMPLNPHTDMLWLFSAIYKSLGYAYTFENGLVKLPGNYGTKLIIHFKFSLLSTKSSKKLIQLFINLNFIKLANPDLDIRIIWFYPEIDEDLMEIGEYYKTNSDSQIKDKKNKIHFKLKSYVYS